MHFRSAENFQQWRDHARTLLTQETPPDQVQWSDRHDQLSLFGDEAGSQPADADHAPSQSLATTRPWVPRKFLELASPVACHRSADRWTLLYRVLWRLTHGERHLLHVSTDDDVYALTRMQKEISRDVHKMKAFVRFRKVDSVPGESTIDEDDATEHYIAWHRPDHRIVRLAAPFFSRRFKGMNWTILTPDESVTWDQSELSYGPGATSSDAPSGDALEELWKTYYASIFNPARVKVAMMKREMPVRHWPTLPEAELIADLLHEAPKRRDEMIDKQEGFAQTAAHYMPPVLTLPALAEAAQGCQACDLCHHATGVVFGQGPADAAVVIVGEQPGDQEDRCGRPFVGPAGQLLDQALAEIGMPRSDVYITNTVKHFKFTRSGQGKDQRRLHQKPDSREIFACRPWLEAELSIVGPRVIVCLGATAAQALMGRDFRITQSRGRFQATEFCQQTIATWHPASILRMRDSQMRRHRQQQWVDDLRAAIAAAREESGEGEC